MYSVTLLSKKSLVVPELQAAAEQRLWVTYNPVTMLGSPLWGRKGGAMPGGAWGGRKCPKTGTLGKLSVSQEKSDQNESEAQKLQGTLKSPAGPRSGFN